MTTPRDPSALPDDYPLPKEAGDAETFKRRILGESPKSVLEVSRAPTAYSLLIAEVLKMNGGGAINTLEAASSAKNKKFYRLLSAGELEEHHSIISFKKSYHWALQRLISDDKVAPFDICLLNANKRFESCAVTAVLLDLLLRPGGLLVIPGSNWSIETSPHFKERPELMSGYDKDELSAHPIELVRDIILDRLNYDVLNEPNCPEVIFARKPK